MLDPLKTDLRLVFPRTDEADLMVGLDDLDTVSGLDNLVQALQLRLLVDRGELSGLGHPRYGSRVRELIGEPLDQANMELLRRYVQKTLLDDPRVEEVTRVVVRPRQTDPEAVDVVAKVTAVAGGEAEFEVALYGS